MNRISGLLFLSAFTFFGVIYAQQDAARTMFWNNYLNVNPATAGFFNAHEANVSYRNQWDKVNGAPNSFFGNYSAKVDKVHGGLGLSYSFDAIGFNRQQSALANYAFHLDLGDSTSLSFGLAAGIVHFGFDPQWNPPTSFPDSSLPQASNATGFDANFGVVFRHRQMTFGASLTHLTSPSLAVASSLNGSSGVAYNSVMHSHLFGEYRLSLSNDLVSISRAQFRTDFVKSSVDISEMVMWRNRIWAGIGYRTTDALAFMVGCDHKERYRLGYSYELTLNKLAGISRGTHEIALSFFIK